jgi:protein-L-isoaspartate(D-aspartate) O-methyltransferase
LVRLIAPSVCIPVIEQASGNAEAQENSGTRVHAVGIWGSRAMYECGLMPIRGVGGVAERNIRLTGTGITIRIDDGQPADATALRKAITSAPAQAWTGVEVTVTGELDFWLAGQDAFFRLLAGTEAAQRSGLVSPAFNWGAMGLLSSDSFAYPQARTTRPQRAQRLRIRPRSRAAHQQLCRRHPRLPP